MSEKPVAIASDHAGVGMKQALADELQALGHEVLDLGTDGTESVDYPDYGGYLAAAIEDGRAARGVLVCGTGIGISIAANRLRGVRAARCTSEFDARLAREHNDANVLALGSRVTGSAHALAILEAFLGASFEGGRHARRVAKLDAEGS